MTTETSNKLLKLEARLIKISNDIENKFLDIKLLGKRIIAYANLLQAEEDISSIRILNNTLRLLRHKLENLCDEIENNLDIKHRVIRDMEYLREIMIKESENENS